MLIGSRDGDNKRRRDGAVGFELRRLSDVTTASRGLRAASCPIRHSSKSPKSEVGRMLDAETAEQMPASSPSRATTSTLTTKCACSWRSVRASRRTRSPASKPTWRFGGPETMEFEDLCAAHRLAELDLPALPMPSASAQALRHRPAAASRIPGGCDAGADGGAAGLSNPAKAGTHNHQTVGLLQAMPTSLGHGVSVPALRGDDNNKWRAETRSAP